MKTEQLESGTGDDLLQRAVRALAESTGFVFEAETRGVTAQPGPDGYIRVPGTESANELWPVEINRHINKATLALLAHQPDRPNQVLVTEYVSPPMADRLKELRLPFIDTAGNAYLEFHPFHIFVKGMKPKERPSKGGPARLFQTTGLKMIFALLCKPDTVNQSYREIAALSGVALGTVAIVMDELQRFGFLQSVAGRRRLVRKRELVPRWVSAYSERLRPKLVIGTFETDNLTAWKTTELSHAYWGGEVAAAKITKYLQPEIMTIYVRDKHQEANLQLKLKLRRSSDANVELLRAFWTPQLDPPEPGLTPILLTYADLLGTAEARNIETAKILYEQQIDRLVRED